MNKPQAVMDLISTCPMVGADAYFNFVDETTPESNTSLLTDGYGGEVIKKYVDGDTMKKFQCVIRQVKPLSRQSNTTENIEEMQAVKKFLDWINEQGKKRNFPDFGEKCEVQKMSTPEGVDYPMLAGEYEGTALYSFPFEITYIERM